MEIEKEKLGKIRRHRVDIIYRDGQRFVHEICDLALPSPDGRYFVVRDVTAGEIPGKKGDSVDSFYPTDLIGKITLTAKQYFLKPNGARGEEVLDKEPEKSQLIA